MLNTVFRKPVLVLGLSFALLGMRLLIEAAAVDQTKSVADSAGKNASLSKETAIDQTSDAQKLRERVSTIEGRLQELDKAITASTQSATSYAGYVTIVFSVVTLIGAIIGFVYKNWIANQVEQVQSARKQVEQIISELSSAIAIAKAVPPLLRSNLEEKDTNRKRLHAREAYHYLVQAEAKGSTDSHLLNWKAYTLRRMDLPKQALEAAHAALENSKSDIPQRARAFYNIACYYAKFVPGNEQKSLDNLQQAVLADEWYKPVARSDADFESIRKEPKLNAKFREIVGTDQLP